MTKWTRKQVWMGLLLAGAGAWAVRSRRALRSLRGKVVLITGGSRGLGLVLARTFGAAGARVAICARDPVGLDRAMADLRGRGVASFSISGDVSDPQQAAEIVKAVARHFGGLDVLVNNAGVIQVGPQACMTVDDYQEAMRINFFAALHTCLAAIPLLPRPGGHIVNISSVGGKIAVPHLLPYSVSKFALTGFSQGLRAELLSSGIEVTTVCPGLMRTGSPRNASFKGQNHKEYAWFNVSDSLPGLTVSAEAAARRIVRACALGQAEVVLGAPAQLAVLFNALLPAMTNALLAQVSRLLPGPGGIGARSARGYESQGVPVPEIVTRLSEEAARLNNEKLR